MKKSQIDLYKHQVGIHDSTIDMEPHNPQSRGRIHKNHIDVTFWLILTLHSIIILCSLTFTKRLTNSMTSSYNVHI